MTQFNYKIANAKNRALVCYCATNDGTGVKEAVKSVFQAQNIEIGEFIDGGGETQYTLTNVVGIHFDPPQPALNIALKWNETSRRLRVGGSFSDVSVGVYFYNASQPVDTRGTMAEINEFFGEEIEPEPPSITSLVCNALQEAFEDGKAGASAFVINPETVDFELEVE